MSPTGLGLVELLIIVVFVPLFVFWGWTLADCALKESDTGNTKLVWVIIIILAGIVGAAIYFFARRAQRKAELGR